ncbi:MAG: M42 family metallopeptidase [Elusimicrobiota bacterium]|jgi:endoglucanase|nr:M42 family metallopeptidase [Elusimicrobiota bacterium]
MDFKLFSKLSALPAASGREELLRAEITKIIKPFVDEVKVDSMGNLIALKKGKGLKKLMLAAHMDEVALRIRHIDDKGFLRFITTGGVDPRTLLSQRVLIQTEENGLIHGVIGSKPAHYLTPQDAAKPITLESLFIDTGLSKEEAFKKITIGDPAVLDRQPIELGGDFFSARAIDDRAGVYVLIKLLEQLPKKPQVDIYFVFTTQEERGLIGAQTAAARINPDIALAIDTTGALDVPGVTPQDYVLQAGKGIGITLVDALTIAHSGLAKHLREIAAKNKIPHQLRVSPKGGNDASAMQKSNGGVPACALSVPVRYIHSNVEVANKKDIDAAQKLVALFIEQCASKKY